MADQIGDHAYNHPLAQPAARVVVPTLVDITGARSALDVGCGSGAWVKTLLDHGVAAMGVDAPGMPASGLLIGDEHLHRHDLRKPLALGRRFDLVLCLEVGEHLPEQYAATLVESLVRHSPVVVFSAAIPGQGGQGHVNEQWQSYWAAIFAAHSYKPYDCLRRDLWEHPEVARWYAQNTLLYADPDGPHCLTQAADDLPLDLVHPRLYAKLLSCPSPEW